MAEKDPKIKLKITNKFISSVWKLITLKIFVGDIEEQISHFMRVSLAINIVILLLLLPIDGIKDYALGWLKDWVIQEYNGEIPKEQPIITEHPQIKTDVVEIKPQAVIQQDIDKSYQFEQEKMSIGNKALVDTISYKIKQNPEKKQQIVEILGIKNSEFDSFLK